MQIWFGTEPHPCAMHDAHDYMYGDGICQIGSEARLFANERRAIAGMSDPSQMRLPHVIRPRELLGDQCFRISELIRNAQAQATEAHVFVIKRPDLVDKMQSRNYGAICTHVAGIIVPMFPDH